MKTEWFRQRLLSAHRLYPTFKEWKLKEPREKIDDFVIVYILPLRNENFFRIKIIYYYMFEFISYL